MEMNFNGNDFERFLREKADEFTLYPSKRVWYSIYNNMHPGNRLPSVSMCIVLLGLLFFTGYLNTRPVSNHNVQPATITAGIPATGTMTPAASLVNNSQVKGNQQFAQAGLQHNASSRPVISQKATTARSAAHYNTASLSAAPAQHTAAITRATPSSETRPEIESNRTGIMTKESRSFAASAGSPDAAAVITLEPAAAITSETVDFNTTTSSPDQSWQSTTTPVDAVMNKNPSIDQAVEKENKPSEAADNTLPSPATTAGNQAVPTTTVPANSRQGVKQLSETDLSWIEHDVLYNRRAPRKWAGKLSWQAYATPSVVYRTLQNNAAGKALSGNGTGFFNSASLNNVVRHKPSVGLEAGLVLQYDLMKKVKVKGGVQLNFTRYNALAYENHHPISTSLTMNGNDPFTVYELFRSTNYSNMVGLNEVKLHNQTFQFSLPMGVDYRLAKAGQLSWYAGATIQPSFVLFAQTYLISSDRRNYVKDGSMLNRINLNAGFETYLSFQTADYSWQIGPQFRTQLFSTNNKIYSVEERLMSVGIKAGITRKF